MSQQTDEGELSLREAVANALEAARTEVVGRMTQQGLPLTETVPEFQIIDNDTGTSGWSGVWGTAQVSGLRDMRVHLLIADNSVPLRPLGLRPQLEHLADLLDKTTDLGTRPGMLAPGSSGVEAIVARYLAPLAYEYLGNLPDLGQPDPALVDRLTDELEELIAPDVIYHTSQLAIEGLRVSAPLAYRGVTLRPLSPSERGQYWQSRNDNLLSPYRSASRFVVPRNMTMVTPAVLLEATTSRPRTQQFSQSTLMNQVALAFYLLGYDIAGTGLLVSFDRPTWATLGQSHQRYVVDEKPVTGERLVSEDEFHQVVDLAYQMPEFGPGESNSREIALYRTLRGLGMHWQESGFLDFVIALEAALLQGVEDELSYRFALYGSLFLGRSADPRLTFAKLKNIYTVRSKLVHGSTIKPTKRQQALDDSPVLAKAIVVKAIQQGWPDMDALNELALKVMP